MGFTQLAIACAAAIFISLLIAIALIVSFTGCQKEPGPGGRSHIYGHVEHSDDHVVGAFVYIWYGVTNVTDHHSGYDDQTTTNAEGEFEFEELTKGDYYLHATWTESSGEEKDGDVSVTIKKKAEKVKVHIEVD